MNEMVPVQAKTAIVLLARGALAANPMAEMTRLAETARALGEGDVVFAFTEQGDPSFRTVMLDLAARGVAEVLVVPLFVPMEPSTRSWLRGIVQRWRTEAEGPWPEVRFGPPPGALLAADMLQALIAAARSAEPVPPPRRLADPGSVVPDQKRRVLVCDYADCHLAGAQALWGHLRNEQARLELRSAGDGVMSCKTSCLGPCNLAPVVQVWPEGTTYGGVDEAGIDRIIAEHLIGGRVVEDLAYPADGRKHRLRDKAAGGGTI